MTLKREGADRDLFETVFERFLRSPTKKGLERRQRTIKEWRPLIDKDVLPQWKGKRIQEIERRDVRELLEAVRDRGGGVSTNRVYSCLSASSPGRKYSA